jgi:hypothetical protein
MWIFWVSYEENHTRQAQIPECSIPIPMAAWKKNVNSTISPYPNERSNEERFDGSDSVSIFWARSCLYVKSDSVHICTETFFIFQEILRAKSDCAASMQFDRRPMALPYPYGRRLEDSVSMNPMRLAAIKKRSKISRLF